MAFADMHKRQRGADRIGLPHELLRVVLQFLIDDLRTWHMLLQVSQQFKKCVLDPPSLKHVKVAMGQHFGRARLVPGLRTLRLQTHRVDHVVDELHQSPPMLLQTLDLSGRGSTPDDLNRGVRGGVVTKWGLRLIARIPTLTAVDLTNCTEITNIDIQALAPLADTMLRLNMSRCPGINDQALQWLPGEKMRYLYLNDCGITDAGMRQVARQSELRELGLGRCLITDAGVKALASLVQLELLDVTGCDLITDEGIQALDQLVVLQSLSSSGCNGISLECLRKRPWAGTLRALDFRRCSMGNTDATAFDPFRRLQTLSLGGRAVCDTAVQSLSRLAAVQTLNLTRCGSLTGIVTMTTLSQMTNNLQELDLSRCSAVTDANLLILRQLKELQMLNLSMNRGVTDLGVLALSKRLLALRTLDLSSCAITDVGMQHLSRMVTLHRLEVAYCDAITDEGVRHLLSLVELQSLNLSNDWRVTTTGVTALQPLLALRDVRVRDCPRVEYCHGIRFRVRTS